MFGLCRRTSHSAYREIEGFELLPLRRYQVPSYGAAGESTRCEKKIVAVLRCIRQ